MESFDDYKAALTGWLDTRIEVAVKTAVDEANTKLVADLDTRFAAVNKGINDLGVMMSAVSRDVGGVTDSVATLAKSVLAIPVTIAQSVQQAVQSFNPFK